jgi:signal recognition particle GTPase
VDAPETSRGRDEAPRRVLDDAMIEELEDLLVQADLGVDTALKVTANIAAGRMGRKLTTAEIKGLLAAEIARIMEPVARPMPLVRGRPQVVLVVGVNGAGKTTTIGKLASAVPRRPANRWSSRPATLSAPRRSNSCRSGGSARACR